MIGMFFCDEPVRSFEDAKKSDLPFFSKFFQGMRREGVYIAPSQFEALFLSSAHTAEHIGATVRAAEKVLDALRR
jgi:glutamate-1-semialdehyde 2,1-aminomutase